MLAFRHPLQLTKSQKGENQVSPLQVITFHQPTTVDKEPRLSTK